MNAYALGLCSLLYKATTGFSSRDKQMTATAPLLSIAVCHDRDVYFFKVSLESG